MKMNIIQIILSFFVFQLSQASEINNQSPFLDITGQYTQTEKCLCKGEDKKGNNQSLCSGQSLAVWALMSSAISVDYKNPFSTPNFGYSSVDGNELWSFERIIYNPLSFSSLTVTNKDSLIYDISYSPDGSGYDVLVKKTTNLDEKGLILKLTIEKEISSNLPLPEKRSSNRMNKNIKFSSYYEEDENKFTQLLSFDYPPGSYAGPGPQIGGSPQFQESRATRFERNSNSLIIQNFTKQEYSATFSSPGSIYEIGLHCTLKKINR